MIHRVILPKLGTNMETAVIVKWLVHEGDHVVKGAPLAEVDTSKAVFEVESEASGVLRKIVTAEGATVPVTDTIAIIADETSDISKVLATIALESKRASERTTHNELVRRQWLHSGRTDTEERKKGDVVKMSPAARFAARASGLDMEAIARAGTGKVLQSVDITELLPKVKRTVIFGAGLGAKQILEAVRLVPHIRVIGLVDDDKALWGQAIKGLVVESGFERLKEMAATNMIDAVVLSFHSQVRRKIHMKIRREIPDLEIASVVDSRAIIGEGVQIGLGALIEAGAVIGPDTVIGEGAIVDVGVTIAHDCYIGPFCHLSPGCTVSGIVRLDEHVLVGVGASINSTTTVGRNVVIVPNSAVMHDVPPDKVVSGIPAEIIGESRRGM